MRSRWLALLAVGLVGGGLVRIGEESPSNFEPAKLAEFVVRLSGFTGGVCVVLEGDVELALSLGKRGRFVVQALYGGRSQVEGARRAIRERGLYGRICADLWSPPRLPYAENLVNILVAPDFEGLHGKGLKAEEVFRVLRPLGVALLGVKRRVREVERALRTAGFVEVRSLRGLGLWVLGRKPWPRNIDEWTHFTHGPDGNPVAKDEVVGQPTRLQWVSRPLWLRAHDTDSSIMAVVTARGRMFYFEDKAPIGLPGDHPLPDNWHLVARDAFNGVLLWEVPIRGFGWREWKDTWYCRRSWDIPLNVHRRLVAVGERVYVTLGYNAPVSELDARTGEVLRTFEGTRNAREILVCQGNLIASVKEHNGLRLVAL
ncbi:MAG TPA: hypothetical protein EYP65_01870, partial [Armatimonadetes bacterium]|nr:hypothetical protein [Armatimonadota bacterium]